MSILKKHFGVKETYDIDVVFSDKRKICKTLKASIQFSMLDEILRFDLENDTIDPIFCSYCDKEVVSEEKSFMVYVIDDVAKLQCFCSHVHRRNWIRTVYNDSLFKLCLLKICKLRKKSEQASPTDDALFSTLPVEVVEKLVDYTILKLNKKL